MITRNQWITLWLLVIVCSLLMGICGAVFDVT